ncbi:MAG: Gfo/Idh/MocA family oxidoreductase [Planctomycetaceae bacterium]|jgi:predicted dehydrogenase|nr:Gfo/Idh/MocA family oxidoreductase [Planctomycetaceae bacterium]MBT6154094.1 Gfo/Idh/MocA family oxidoreductase [Planctomycetaceae bacterium]MBT6486351.1 Gfo/Idh/MocA family oxidoreductase [Planctomycetaceae bacterium]MBT6494479.1 Gfo/Idh/MocA family oxidoreductase [Planctomycetaceae bacterium]
MTQLNRTINRRNFLQSGIAAGLYVAGASGKTFAANANEEINLGFIGCGGRGGDLIRYFKKIDGVNIAGMYDPDPGRAQGTKNSSKTAAEVYPDIRKLLEDDGIDAVVIAACNHWHCLAAIWAMEAGKDVYVEKPLSHSQWEGQQTVAAARKYNRICQVGTQQRSDPMQAEIQKFLHEDKALGNILSARVNRYGRRGPIGKRKTPLVIDSKIDYDMWLGPAQREPLYRNSLHYDWHWDWNTGSGEMGNWGVHVLDDVRNNVFQDKVALPKRIMGGGGRVAWNDAGESPNVHFVYFDTGSIPVVIGLSNLQERGSAKHPGPGSGYIAYCEGGRLEGQRGRAVAFDKDGKQIKSFKGRGGNGLHQQNFIDAVRSRDASSLNTDVQVGHLSTGWCNLANIAFRAGSTFSHAAAKEVTGDRGVWGSLLGETERHLGTHNIKIESTQIKLSPMLTVDVENELFIGDHAKTANAFLKRQYRKGYEVPEIVLGKALLDERGAPTTRHTENL